jgi:hypothetical protein
MRHTFLLEEGVWKAAGRYFDESGAATEAEGETRILHRDAVWINEGVMRLLKDPVVEAANRYEIVPIAGDADFTTWTSANVALGTLRGQFVLVRDAILSSYESSKAGYRGVETLLRQSGDRYIARGALFKSNVKISSWAMTLTRQD